MMASPNTPASTTWPEFLRTARFLLTNPVFIREITSGLRSSKLFLILSLYLFAPFLALLSSWPNEGLHYGGSYHARILWEAFMVIQVLLILLLNPIFGAYMISSEYKQRTMDFLGITQIPIWVILLSKVGASAILGFALLTISLAPLSLIFYLGGVPWLEILLGYLTFILLILFVSTLSIQQSKIQKDGNKALAATYGILLTLPMILPCFLGLFINFTLSRGGGSIMLPHWLQVAAVFSIILFPFTIGLLISIFSQSREPLGETAKPNIKPIDDPQLLQLRKKSWPFYLVDPMKRIPPIPDGRHLAFIAAGHEERVNPLHRSEWKYFIPTVTLTFFLFGFIPIMITEGGDSERILKVCWYLHLLALILWTPLLHAHAMTTDTEMKTLDMVRLTLLGPREFGWGKWLASIKNRKWMLGAACLCLLFLHFFFPLYPGSFLIMPLAWLVMVESIGLLAFAISSFCRSLMFAIMGSLGTSIALLILEPFPQTPGATILLAGKYALIGTLSQAIMHRNIRRLWKLERAPTA